MDTPKLEIREGKFYLLENFTYVFPNNNHVTVEKGYQTDLASIPWFARWLVSPADPTILVAAIVHDWLCQQFKHEDGVLPVIYNSDGTFQYASWAHSASILKQIMDENGATTWKKMSVYWAVRLHGFIDNKK